jgi:hypothetical protein
MGQLSIAGALCQTWGGYWLKKILNTDEKDAKL